jgi:hypothetical protein
MMFVGVLLAAGCANEEVGTVSQPAIATNAIATNAIATNAIATNAIATNAIATNAIATNAIATNAILQTALEDPNARIFMKYLVSCALPAGHVISWRSMRTRARDIFEGSLGLCAQWETGAPDQLCRERVSACILARNNAFGHSVQFSMRGMQTDSDPLKPADSVPPHDHIIRTNSVVPSTQPCPFSMTGETRDCGWTRASIGLCEPGKDVFVATGNFAKCDPGGFFLGTPGAQNNMLRICAGTHACDAGDPDTIASVDDACAALGTTDPGVDFVCPANGYYSVMTAAYKSDDEPDGKVGALAMMSQRACGEAACFADASCCGGWGPQCEALCAYPSPEQVVFRWHEGSFYGDLFAGLDPAKPQLRVNPETLKIESRDPKKGWIEDGGKLSRSFVGVVYPEMHACTSKIWKQPEAYMQERICAGPNPTSLQCAANWEGQCLDVCATLDGPPISHDFDAAGCRDPRSGRVFEQPMTTFLAGPCDVAPASCATTTSTPQLPW